MCIYSFIVIVTTNIMVISIMNTIVILSKIIIVIIVSLSLLHVYMYLSLSLFFEGGNQPVFLVFLLLGEGGSPKPTWKKGRPQMTPRNTTHLGVSQTSRSPCSASVAPTGALSSSMTSFFDAKARRNWSSSKLSRANSSAAWDILGSALWEAPEKKKKQTNRGQPVKVGRVRSDK